MTQGKATNYKIVRTDNQVYQNILFKLERKNTIHLMRPLACNASCTS